MFYEWKPYRTAAQRRHRTARHLAKLGEKGLPLAPVVVDGRTIARTFWGKAWCDNLERYSDYANRLPRGRTYLRARAVLDLQIAPGVVTALVSGTRLYRVRVKVATVQPRLWRAICRDCAGAIDSLVELLRGRFSPAVMERLCCERTGLFPWPAEIQLSCSCPDWASMCKHVAAVLYGIGARLDQQPELLFTLRKVDEKDLIAHAGAGLPSSTTGPRAGKILDTAKLADVFGIEMADELQGPAGGAGAVPRRANQKQPRRKH
jgi:uncharacterized Zn finger protein